MAADSSGNTPRSLLPASGKPRRILLAAIAVLVVCVAAVLIGWTSQRGPEVRGLEHTPVNQESWDSGVVNIVTDSPGGVHVTLDGRQLPVRGRDGTLAPAGVPLADGQHVLRVTAPSWLGETTTTQPFTVDNRPPRLEVPDSLTARDFDQPVTVRGKAPGAVRVRVAGRPVPVSPNGDFSTPVARPGSQVAVTAADAAGNTSRQAVHVSVRHPGMRAVHMTGMAWSSAKLREPVLRMIREGKIDTVELDIKDEDGEVTYDSRVPLANRIGAAKGYYRAREAIDQIHSLGARVVGRLVAFHDPKLGAAAWNGGQRDQVVQTAGGQPWTQGYGDYAFTNFAHPAVRQYNVDIAREAAQLGFDDILYDYVRRPDGSIEKMRFPGLATTPEHSIAEFLGETREALRPTRTYLGASIFGISANRPTQIAQSVPMMAEYADYISPMIYPSHWGPGEYGVSDPDSQPYEIVRQSLADFTNQVRGTNTQVFPWLQDFSLGMTYGPHEVEQQIAATRDTGIDSFLLWSAACRYHDTALAPDR